MLKFIFFLIIISIAVSQQQNRLSSHALKEHKTWWAIFCGTSSADQTNKYSCSKGGYCWAWCNRNTLKL